MNAALPGGSRFDATRFTADGRRGMVESQVIEEDVLTLEVEGIGQYALMWTPTRAAAGAAGYTRADGVLADEALPERLALAAGFVFTEGLIDGLADIEAMSVCPERPDVVRMRLATAQRTTPRRRDVVVNSACGICGGREQLEAMLGTPRVTGSAMRLAAGDFTRLLEALRARQFVFGRTGGAHAAMSFDAGGEVLAFAEDLGRHNALDKVIGCGLLEGRPRDGTGVLVSSRLSYEMLNKAARAGFEVVAAISAPTTLAVEMARRAGITLCAFVRGDGIEVYSHPERIVAARFTGH